MPTAPAKPDLITAQEAAEYLGIKQQTLAVWRITGRQRIPYIRVGSRIKYRRADLDKWLASRTVEGPDEDAD